MMSIVLINLVIGLSISDISTLRKEAHIHKLINTVTAIKSVENLQKLLSWMFPFLKINTRVTSNNKNNVHMLDEKIYLDIPNLDYTTESYIYIVRDGFDLPERYTWPRGIIHAVADIVKQRHILLHNKHAENKRRESLLRKVNKMEDEFVETACKTLI